eukprot:TRINITY_DN20753_c0_g1_i2.p2 TRINITY_DN20753_c0_g1~~TRINITY_DN20753_c0_g1_i2.p2  ORF type:complete len:102 (+),score=18.45 TRINITY_DN20753_c0_g1_i2:256-561(+)
MRPPRAGHLWQLLASVTLPAMVVKAQVGFTVALSERAREALQRTQGRARAPAQRVLRYVGKSPRLRRFGPTCSGLALIPLLPYVMDPPITKFVDMVDAQLQ